MTLAASGQITSTDVKSELRTSGSVVFSSSVATNNGNWLAERTSTSFIWPTHLYSMSGVKETATSGFSAASGSHSFAGISLGPNYTGRSLKIVVFLASKLGASVPGIATISSVTCAGTAVGGVASLPFYQGGSGSSDFVATTLLDVPLSVTATSGTIEFSTNLTTRAFIVVLSCANCSLTPNSGSGSFQNSATGDNVLVNIPTNGVLIAAAIKINGNALAWTNVTERLDSSATLGSTYRYSYGWSNRLSFQGNRNVSFTGTGSAPISMGAASYGD